MPFAIIIFILSLATQGCESENPTGQVEVLAPSDGTFEIYKIGSEYPLQFVSEQIGYFNKKIKLQPGSYLILADCSSETIIIHPNKTITMTAHEVRFIPPTKPQQNDRFRIQCDRYPETGSRQNLVNQYQLIILDGKRKLLVGMVPLEIDFTAQDQPESPKSLRYHLSGIQVANTKKLTHKSNFFVSLSRSLISITEHQKFGHWLYLLPGDYVLELNGTHLDVKLRSQESRIVAPSFLKVSISNQVDLKASPQISGTPLYVELNKNYWLDLGETYPVLPGTATLRLDGSADEHQIELKENELLEKIARSVVVQNDCPPFEWTCLGNKKIYLYREKESWPFSEGITDVPILFLGENVSVTIQGSRDIRYQLSQGKRDSKIKIGKIRFIPNLAYRPGNITDLARVEAYAPPTSGHTLDVDLTKKVVMPLPAGNYYFAQYVSLSGLDGERRKTRRPVKVRPGKILTVQYTVYVKESKLQAYKNQLKKNQENRRRKNKIRYAHKYRVEIKTRFE